MIQKPGRPAIAFPAISHKNRLKILLGRLLHPKQTERWLQFISENAVLSEQIAKFPLAVSKIYRPYLSNRLSCNKRVGVLIDHYRFLSQQGLDNLVARAANEPVLLSTLNCKSVQPSQIHLTSIHDGHREGDLCLRLTYNGQHIFSASLVFFEQDGAMLLMVGRLQGVASEQARNLVREATRDYYSCRPGSLLVLAARHIAHVLGCERVLLVSNVNRITINLWRRLRISSNYDQLWTEMGALPRSDGNFEIASLATPAIDIEALPSKKRSEARKKLALQEAMFVDLAGNLAAARQA